MSYTKTLSLFRARMGEVLDLQSINALLQWDQEVMMPPKGAEARGRQIATLSKHGHRLFVDDATGALISELEAAGDALSPDEQAMVSETRHDYDRARCVPEDFVEDFASAQSQAYQAWVEARKQADFARFLPLLERMIDLLRRRADYLGYEGSPYNALLGDYERGLRVEQLQSTFAVLATRQRDLVARIVEKSSEAFPWLDQKWDEAAQEHLTVQALRDIGYDFEAGRQDRSPHPFSLAFDTGDARVTTRYVEDDLFAMLTGSLHEGGHALYEQGYLDSDRRTILAAGISLAVHESQSRMWENLIGRSRAFWKHYTPILQELHAPKLDGLQEDDLYRAINRVQPSLIRVEADECTYNLHIILRFELELALVEGELQAADVPAAWNEKMRDYLGVEVPNDALGCLQDVHWSHGSMGYFPTYALGNLYASQLMEAIERDVPDLGEQVARANFAPMLQWLREKVHQVGRRKTAEQCITDATGSAPTAEPYLRYLETKYGALYDLA